jgi:hypothetical protein
VGAKQAKQGDDNREVLVVPHFGLDLFSMRSGEFKESRYLFVKDEPIYVPMWAAKAYYDHAKFYNRNVDPLRSPPSPHVPALLSPLNAPDGVDATPLDGLMV